VCVVRLARRGRRQGIRALNSARNKVADREVARVDRDRKSNGPPSLCSRARSRSLVAIPPTRRRRIGRFQLLQRIATAFDALNASPAGAGQKARFGSR